MRIHSSILLLSLLTISFSIAPPIATYGSTLQQESGFSLKLLAAQTQLEKDKQPRRAGRKPLFKLQENLIPRV
ncbi:MAG TPA: hypothetical protein V6C90_06090 [Coleofasciculaceae cyanobacterium]|jgi:hypothetical protein